MEDGIGKRIITEEELRKVLDQTLRTLHTVQQYSSIPQSPDTAPQTDTSWPPPASSNLLWPCSHTERKDEKVIVNRDKHTVINGFLHGDFTSQHYIISQGNLKILVNQNECLRYVFSLR